MKPRPTKQCCHRAWRSLLAGLALLGLFLPGAGCSGEPDSDAEKATPTSQPAAVQILTTDGILRVPELGFEAAMPGAVTRRQLATPLPTFQFDSSLGGANPNDYVITLSLMVSQYPGELGDGGTAAIYEQVKIESAVALNGDVEFEKAIEIDGNPAIEFGIKAWDPEKPRFMVRRVVIIGERLYYLTTLTIARQHRVRTGRLFLESFKSITE